MSTTDEFIEKPSGGDDPSGPRSLDDIVDEASRESFPCSDAPSFTSLRVGAPLTPGLPVVAAREERTERGEEAPVVRRPARVEQHAVRDHARACTLARTQGIFFVASGLWPVVHLRSFEAVTGAKHDKWLVRTVGLLIACVGGALLASARSGRVPKEIALLGASAPAALAGIDVVYTAKRVLPKVYLLDTAIELGFVAAWKHLFGATNTTSRREASTAG